MQYGVHSLNSTEAGPLCIACAPQTLRVAACVRGDRPLRHLAANLQPGRKTYLIRRRAMCALGRSSGICLPMECFGGVFRCRPGMEVVHSFPVGLRSGSLRTIR